MLKPCKIFQDYETDRRFLQFGFLLVFIRAGQGIMRLDKYLKVSRLVKRRTVAAELCQGGHVKINGNTAKPASEVKVGDALQIRFGNRLVSATILRVPEKAVPAQEADSLYQLLEEHPLESPL
jgi:ribosomal 50S subunit-recycling heat shock protein